MENSNNGTPNDALVMRNYGAAQYNLNNFLQALEFYKKSLLIDERLQPNSPDVALTYEIMGSIYNDIGNLPDALRCHKMALRIRESKAPDSLEVADSYSAMGMIYENQGKLTEALQYKKDAVRIKEHLAPNSLEVARSYNSLGSIYDTLGNLPEALKYYQKALFIQERLAPDSLDIIATWNNIAIIDYTQGRVSDAVESFKKIILIEERLVPNSLDVATTYNNIGEAYQALNNQTEALRYYEKSRLILERLAPDSLRAASTYKNLASIYKLQGRLSEALALDKITFRIKRRDLIPTHGDLIALSHSIANTALQLMQYDVALEYANICIEIDSTFKYAYDIKGRVFQQQGQLQKAVAAFDSALACDAGYADAALHKVGALKELAKMTGNFTPATDAIAQAQAMLKTNYDATLKAEYENNALTANQSMEVQLPQQRFEVGSPAFTRSINDLNDEVNSMKREINNVKQRVSATEVRMDTVESRLNILDQKVYGLQHSMEILSRAKDDIQQRMDELKQDSELTPAVRQDLMNSLLSERSKMKEREKEIKRFNKDPDLSDFYHALISELSAAFIAATVIGSNKVAMTGSTQYTQASSAAGVLIQIIPMIGPLASSLTNGIAVVADTIHNVKTQNDLLRIKELAPTMDEFDRIAMRVAVQLTLAHETQIRALKGAVVPVNWKTHVRSIGGGLEGFIASFIADNNTLAKLWGRAEAQAIITHLQEPHVAENYRYEDEQEDYSRLSVVANSILSTRNQPVASAPSPVAVPETSWGTMSVPNIVAAPMNLDSLIKKCREYSSEKPVKMRAMQDLISKLEHRAEGSISSQEMLEFISYQLKVTHNPAFDRSSFGLSLGKSTAKSLCEQCRDVMNADIARVSGQDMNGRGYFGIRSGGK